MKDEYIGLIIAIPLLIVIIFECAILGIAYFNADTIECTWLWCTFTTERTDINQTIRIERSEECYANGEKINCTLMGDIFDVP